MRLTLACCIVGVLSCAEVANADTIDFESIPGAGTPTDGMSISSQFLSSFGVTFSLEGGGAPVLAQVGGVRTAFQGYELLADQPAPGVSAGSFFLTDDGVVEGPPAPLLITYLLPVFAASGIILDIDGSEAWEIQARDSAGATIESVFLGPQELDGSASFWSFSRGAADIYSIRFLYTGSQTGGVGLAFDNFSPSMVAVPLPSTLLLVASVLPLLVWTHRRVRRYEAASAGR